MGNACLYIIDGYDCQNTGAELCYKILESKFYERITTQQQRELFPACAANINSRDPEYYGPKALALLAPAAHKTPWEGDTLIKIYEHLPNLDYTKWHGFIEKNGNAVDPFKLAGYLEDQWKDTFTPLSWQALDYAKQKNTLKNAEEIIHFFLEFYRERDNFDILESSLQTTTNDVRRVKVEFAKKGITENVEAFSRARDWHRLHDYLLKIRKEDYPFDFIKYLNSCERECEGGIKYLEIKEKLSLLINDNNLSTVDSLLEVCLDSKKEIMFLFSNREKYEKNETIEAPFCFSKEIYNKILVRVKEIHNSEEEYRQLNRFEGMLDTILPYFPGEWGDYKSRLENEIGVLYKGTLDEILKNRADLVETKEAVNALENRIHQSPEIFEKRFPFASINRSLDKLSGHLTIMERLLTQEDPWAFSYQAWILRDLELGFKSLEPSCGEWAVFGKLEKKLGYTLDISSQTREIVEEIDAFIDAVETESSKIVRFELSLNIEQYCHGIDIINEKVNKLLETYGNIRFLTNLKGIATELKQRIFPGGLPTPLPDENKSIISSILDDVKRGDQIYQSLRVLQNRQFDDPIKLIDEFVAIIREIRHEIFILKCGTDTHIIETLAKIQRNIYDAINAILSPMQEVLKGVYPLPSLHHLEKFKGVLTSLKNKHSHLVEHYYEFRILFDPHKQQLKEINTLLEAEELIVREEFAEANEMIRKETSIDYSLQKQLIMIGYYFEKLHHKAWNEINWRNFFNDYFALIEESSHFKYREILEEYETLFKEHLFQVQPNCIGEHYKIFTQFFVKNDLHPYLMCISDNCDAAHLYREIQSRQTLKKHFDPVLRYLIHNRMWIKYVQLYKAVDADLKKNFGNEPFKIAADDLENRYRLIKNEFLTTLQVPTGIAEAYRLIPPDEDFLHIRETYKTLNDLFKDFQVIQQTFHGYKTKDIWIIRHFPAELGQLKSQCNKFHDEWKDIRLKMGWENTIDTLHQLYETGRNLLDRFNLSPGTEPDGFDFLESVSKKGTAIYENQFQFFWNQILDLWHSFETSLSELGDDWEAIKKIFNDNYLHRFKDKWQTLEFYRLWRKEKREEPGNVDQFFAMFREVLENHKKFREFEQDDTISENLANFKTLDPYIDSRLSNMMKDNLLKTRGAR